MRQHCVYSRPFRLLQQLFLCAAFIVCVGPNAAVLAAEAGQGVRPLRVFVLHSYARGSNRTDGLAAGISAVLDQSKMNVQESVEYLDSSRLGKSPLYPHILEAKRQSLALQLEAAPPSVVILTDKQAMDYWLANRASLAPAAPVVYCGVGDTVPDALRNTTGTVAGVVERPGFGATVEAAMRMVPKARKLLVLGEGALIFDAVRGMLEKDLAALSPLLAIEVFRSLDIVTIEARVKTLGPEWLVLVVGRPEDGGRPMPSSEAATRVCGASPVPVFAMWNSWMGHGPVGGKIIVPEEQGAAAGRLALTILRGQGAGMPLRVEIGGAFIFDHMALARFGLSEALLPPGSTLLNKPPSFYEAHKQLVWGYGLVTAFLLILCGVLALSVAYRRKLQAQQAAQMRMVQSLMEGMPTPVFYKDVSGVYQGCNRAFEQFVGRSREEVVGKTASDLVPDALARHFEVQDNILFSGGPTQTYEMEMDTSAGPRLVVFNKALYHDACGRVAGLVGVITDTTAHRQAERALERARNYLQGIIDSSPSAIVCVDRSGVITHTNASAVDYCENPGRGCFLSAAPRLAPLMDDIKLAIDENKPRHLPKRAYRKDGELRFEDVVIYPLSVIGLSEAVVRVEDATERTRLEEVLVQSEKMMSVGGLAAGMAHEINNPLGGIMQSLQVVLNRLRPDRAANLEAAAQAGCAMDAVQEFMERRGVVALLNGARESAQRAAGIVANMLEFSRRSNSAWLQEDVGELVEKALALCQQDYDLSRRYDFRSIALVKELDPSHPTAPCSTQQIQQVILNLVRNAAQAMLAGGGISEPRILVRTVGRQDHVAIEIEDNGPGMDETTRRKIFEPFFTTKAPGQGTGLGLSVSYFIITENHGGRITVESEPGKGTRFIVELPRENVRFA